jgi:hypothetical protein
MRPDPAPTREDRRRPLFQLDAGWLFLVTGLAVLGTAVLIPAYADLDAANLARDRAAAIEENRRDRLTRYGTYLDGLERGDESVIVSLAASQLNMVPEGRQPLDPPVNPGLQNASVFPLLEPDPPRLPEALAPNQSLLAQLANGERSRLWMIGGGALCVLLGVLPAATRGGTDETAQT